MKVSTRFTICPGERLPPGATVVAGGVNFSVFSRYATAMSLLLYESADDPEPSHTVELDPISNRTFSFWHVFIDGLPAGFYYTWKADGPNDTHRTGFRFDPRRELLDPCSRSVSDVLWDRKAVAENAISNRTFRGQIVADEKYDWEGDRPIERRLEDSVIYELHVGGFTRHPSARVEEPGTFQALIEKIPYLSDLGITDVELLPVMAFDPQDLPESAAAKGLTNYWGYSTYGFYAPHPGYCTSSDGRREFRDMVKAFHRAGIGVILDVAFNHTAEGNQNGPSIHFKGLANETFYHVDPQGRSRYRDYTGCGNTVNCNNPVVADFLVRCLEYWVREMHVDGFRFDLASVLSRGEGGEPSDHAPVLWAIEFSPVLANTKLIAEPWDARGLYQAGDFPGFRWMEWNGHYRDTLRRAVLGHRGETRDLATRIAGSSDLYERKGKLPINSVNFVTCHDGFTLWDLVSYEHKHNEINGEDNRDGSIHNFAWNSGVEGPTDDPRILKLRRRQARNHIALLLLSQGLPMLLAGDEALRTQRGNNNAYCQDNEISWFDWTLVKKNAFMLRFTRKMIALRKRHQALRRRQFLTGKPGTGRAGQPDIVWHGERLDRPCWDDSSSCVLAYTLAGQGDDEGDLHVMLNMSEDTKTMAIPQRLGRTWFRAVDTFRESPKDIVRPRKQHPVKKTAYDVPPRSVVVLESR